MSEQLIFVSGTNCKFSEEVAPLVKVFSDRYPQIEIIELSAGKDEQKFSELTSGKYFNSTPTFVALRDGNVIEWQEGRACDNKMAQMFGLEAPRGV
jgi:hypothetical protein